MKKIIILVAMLFSFMAVSSKNTSSNNIETVEVITKDNMLEKDYNFSRYKDKLGEYICLDRNNVSDKVSAYYNDFCYNMAFANKIENKDMSNSLVYSSINDVLKEMKNSLSMEDYRKFLYFINSALKKNGFSSEIRQYSEIYPK